MIHERGKSCLAKDSSLDTQRDELMGCQKLTQLGTEVLLKLSSFYHKSRHYNGLQRSHGTWFSTGSKGFKRETWKQLACSRRRSQ